jgi:hypothetical protein
VVMRLKKRSHVEQRRASPRTFPIKGNLRVRCSIHYFLHVQSTSQRPSSSSSRKNGALRRRAALHALPTKYHPLLVAMAPNNADPEAEKRKAAIAKQRRESVVFPPTLKVAKLTRRYSYVWARQTKDHPTTEALPADLPRIDDKYPFFVGYFYYRLCPPFLDFFDEIMLSYGFRLLDFAPNAITCMSVFAHLCKNFIGILPNVPLFRHFFIPRIESGKALSGSVT